MISLEIKADTKSSGVVKDTKNEKTPVLSFAELLNGLEKEEKSVAVKTPNMLLISESKDDLKQQTLGKKDEIKDVKEGVQKGSVLKLLQGIEQEVTQKKDVSGAFETEEKVPDLKTSFTLNEKLTTLLTPKEVKNLILDAKEYLKNQIKQTKEYQHSQIKELPKTLKGLAKLAKKLDIDVSKITIEKVETSIKEPKLNLKNLQVKEIQKQKFSDIKEQKEVQTKEVKNDLKDLLGVKKEISLKTDEKEITQKSSKLDAAKEPSQIKTVENSKINTVSTKEKKGLEENRQLKSKESKPEEAGKTSKQEDIGGTKAKQTDILTLKNVQTKQKDVMRPVITQTVHSVSIEKERQGDELDLKKVQKTQKVSQTLQEIKTIPIFKQNHTVSLSTQEIVSKKVDKPQLKSTKEKADETLQLLLKGEGVRKNDTALTADFSVATARVIAPQMNNENKKGLKELLHGDLDLKSESFAKTEQVQTVKSDSLDVKINEAKQMVKYLSSDIKDAIDNYKSPFTRVKVQLNPQKLGEVDLTVVQRGKNLHVNLSSNNAAINTLALNANDLKTQLQNNGINNATLNFNNQGESSQQQGQHQNKEQARQEYENFQRFDNDDEDKENFSSLEIIVPRYI